ncbi:class III extradiol dioxygenase subunit B-like domain-containing protein [Streptomyces bluensis]|uniref:class III extradiol dioxygenase subunit B-like domain-containing protein n=1 Tax=Streptomyces bluensis TaxID=33897 RepID=UPI00331956B0
MLVAAAVCPCPPLLVPEVAAGAAPELDAARAACADALGVLAAARPDRLVVVGPADETGQGRYAEGAPGSFRGFGVDVDVRLGRGTPDSAAPNPAAPNPTAPDPTTPERELPPSLAVAAWLLAHTDRPDVPVEGLGVGELLEAGHCVRAGRELAAPEQRVALLVMGDASACRTLKAPGYLDERAAGFDAEVARALGSADVPALKALDSTLAHELKASGRAPWQILAGAAENTALSGSLLYDEAPYGVGYLVAAWS